MAKPEPTSEEDAGLRPNTDISVFSLFYDIWDRALAVFGIKDTVLSVF